MHGTTNIRNVMYVSINKQLISFQNCVGGQRNGYVSRELRVDRAPSKLNLFWYWSLHPVGVQNRGLSSGVMYSNSTHCTKYVYNTTTLTRNNAYNENDSNKSITVTITYYYVLIRDE